VASAICYRNNETLYGRHWGCIAEFDSLHFETCYYQGIDYAISHQLKLFEPGAQGEHKVSRGFVPTETWSTHWIKDSDFRSVIYQFVGKEKEYMKQYIAEMNEHLPFKKNDK
ncbi:MAG: GNAT family N-acetyltransferase, partial [Gammaproteobacteria bacterium]|nr:GNAT family N-acetyltransferase [Gammaproteobacteria bacterium]